mmetsp:Transcript_6978/g.18958  ORF Transcript_6978/g.18958 Transcript_6978/m.18958 type:complete len:93 (-) Transcript_6978:1093-1371(-)
MIAFVAFFGETDSGTVPLGPLFSFIPFDLKLNRRGPAKLVVLTNRGIHGVSLLVLFLLLLVCTSTYDASSKRLAWSVMLSLSTHSIFHSLPH